MSNIQRRPDGKYRARYRDAAGKEHAKHFSRKADATAWLNQVTASQVRGDYVDPKAGKLTVREYAARWEAVQVAGVTQARIIDNALRLHALPALGHLPMGSVLKSDVQAFVKGLSERLAPGSVRNVYEVVQRMFLDAVDDKVIPSTPCRRIVLPKDDSAEVVPPTADEVVALVNAVDARHRALMVLLAGSGLRIGEALGLDVGHVDFLRREVFVERQYTQDLALAPTKGRKSRTVPLSQVVIDELAAHLAQYPSDGPMFTDETGKRLTYRQWKPIWSAACTPSKFKGSTHDLRHFTASALISGGASVKQVQAVLGHASATITLRTYAHLFPGDDDRTRNVMDAVLSPLADSMRTEAASI